MKISVIRSDYKLIRHLCNLYGNDVGMAWQKLPLIQTLPKDINAFAVSDETPLAKAFADLPFDDFIFDMDGTGYFINFPFEVGEKPVTVRLVHYWFRITKASVYGEKARKLSPWVIKGNLLSIVPDKRKKHIPDFYLECWTCDEFDKKVGLFAPNPEITSIQLNPFDYAHIFTDLDKKGLERVDEKKAELILREYWRHIIMAASNCSFLRYTTKYMCEIRPERVYPRKGGAKDKKPWAYQYLPRIIFIDPKKASQQDTCSEGDTNKGTHASPRPHQRRGHYRKYHAERFKNMRGKTQFIKPSWIGPSEWIREGQVYKVLGV